MQGRARVCGVESGARVAELVDGGLQRGAEAADLDLERVDARVLGGGRGGRRLEVLRRREQLGAHAVQLLLQLDGARRADAGVAARRLERAARAPRALLRSQHLGAHRVELPQLQLGGERRLLARLLAQLLQLAAQDPQRLVKRERTRHRVVHAAVASRSSTFRSACVGFWVRMHIYLGFQS